MARATAGGDALVAVALALLSLLSLLSRPSVAPTVRCVALRPSSFVVRCARACARFSS